MSLPDPGKQGRIEEFLRKSLLGEEIINTQFHLFSAKSSTSDRVVKPRVLCANNILLAKSSKYFLDLLSSDIHPSELSLSDLTGDNDMPNNVRIDDYGYASDSDLDDDEEEEEPQLHIVGTEAPKNRPGMASVTPSRISVVTQPKDDDELSDDGSGSASSEMFVMSPEHPRTDPPAFVNVDGPQSVASSETAIHETLENKPSANPSSAAMRLRSFGSRHVLVRDTAFQTWYTLLNYLHTGKFNFLPLSSAAPGGQSYVSSTSARDEPECSAKSMYRLACKVGLDHLRDEAMAHIRNNLSENNILKELSCSLVSRHPELLEMELDVLYAHIASPPIVTGFPALARRIALRELPHGADVIVGIHTRVLRERQSLPPTPRFAPEPASASSSPRSPSVLFAGPPPGPYVSGTVSSPPPPFAETCVPVEVDSLRASPVAFGRPLENSPFGFPGPSSPKSFGFGMGPTQLPSPSFGQAKETSSFGIVQPQQWDFPTQTVPVLKDYPVDNEKEENGGVLYNKKKGSSALRGKNKQKSVRSG